MKTEVRVKKVDTDLITLHEISELIGDVKDYIYDLTEKAQDYVDNHDDELAERLENLINAAEITDLLCDQADEVLAEEFED